MSMVLYPVIFTRETEGFSTVVPDLEGCFSEGDTIEEAYENTFDALGLCLEEYYEEKRECPVPTTPDQINISQNEFIIMLSFDKLKYERKHNTKAIKKTLTIPAWLNELAEERHINFSGLLQSALKQQLHID